MSDHAVMLTGVGNARQLGGYRVGDKKIRKDAFLRSGMLNSLSPESAVLLKDQYALKYIVDFRMSEEQEALPDPYIDGVKELCLPVLERVDMDDPDPEFVAVYADPRSTLRDKFEIIYKKGFINDSLYPDFLLKNRGKQAYAKFFKAVLSLDENSGILWHCTDGKDRTGVASMLLLSALGAERETIIMDYMLTNTFNSAKLQKIRQLPWTAELSEQKLEILLFISGGVIEQFMTHTLDVLEERYGSVEGYLSEELNVKKAELSYLRDKYLEK